jgi:hypothetical protein
MQVIIKEVIFGATNKFQKTNIHTSNQVFQSNEHSIKHASKQFKRSMPNAYSEFWCMVLENILFKSGFVRNKLIKVLICYKVLKVQIFSDF